MSQTFSMPYGHGTVTFSMPTEGYMGTFFPSKEDVLISEEEVLKDALSHPVGTKQLVDLVAGKKNVVIVTSDMTRPCPNDKVLPLLIRALNEAGIQDKDITIVMALGLHRKMTAEEIRVSVGEEVFNRISVINHDADDVVHLGQTRRQTPVEVFRKVVEADFLIGVGNVEFHYFAGFSGGAKAIVPGVASKKTVNKNHSLMIDDDAMAARLDGNPVREDLEEAVNMVGVDFIVNVIINEHHKIIDACCGDVTKAHRTLCDRLAQTGLVPIPQKLDIAVVSAGGYPKDLNMYQAQKGLDNCAAAVKENGVIILLAECPEGYGGDILREWMTSGKQPADLLADIKREFVLGGHKAAAIAKVAANTHVFLVTTGELKKEKMVGVRTFSDVNDAIQEAYKIVGDNATYGLFPLGASTLPRAGKGVV